MGVSVDQGATQPSSVTARSVTTSGVNDAGALLWTQLAMGADRIMFAVDYSYQRNDEAVAFIDAAPLTGADRELICHGNAERVLKI